MMNCDLLNIICQYFFDLKDKITIYNMNKDSQSFKISRSVELLWKL